MKWLVVCEGLSQRPPLIGAVDTPPVIHIIESGDNPELDFASAGVKIFPGKKAYAVPLNQCVVYERDYEPTLRKIDTQ